MEEDGKRGSVGGGKLRAHHEGDWLVSLSRSVISEMADLSTSSLVSAERMLTLRSLTVAGLNALHQLRVGLLPFLLRAQDGEIERKEQEKEGKHLDVPRGRRLAVAGRGAHRHQSEKRVRWMPIHGPIN
jgi:hypothetical protein